MKNKKIINSGEPQDLGDLVNKKYVDNKFIEKDTLLRFQNRNEETFARKNDIIIYTLQNTKLEKMLMYYNIAITHQPRVWLSSHFPYGLFPKLNKIHVTDMDFIDIMGNKVIYSSMPNSPEAGAIYGENVLVKNSEFLLNTEPDKLSRITINIDFKLNFTFIFIARKINASDMGTIFTSTTPNRVLGWRNQ